MDTGFLIYQKRGDLWNLLYPHWQSEVITATYLGAIVFIILAYALWWKLADKQRLIDLLLFGALISLGSSIVDSYGVDSGLWLYRIHLLPMAKSYVLHILTITPLTLMLVQQYSSNWQQFFIWNAAGCGFISFIAKPVLAVLGIYQLMHWNYLYTFILLYIGSTLARGVLHFLRRVQSKAGEEYAGSLQSMTLQPACKPWDKDNDRRK